MKLTFKSFYLILFISLLITSCLDFGKEKTYKENSKESLKTLEWLLNIKLEENVQNTYLYENKIGIDPFYYAKFSLINLSVSEFLDSTWTKSNLPSKLYISEKAPNWYNPKIDLNTEYYKIDFTGGSKSIIYNSINKECFLQYSTH